MAVKKVLIRKEIENNGGTAEISGSIHSDDEVKGDFRVKCKPGDNSSNSSTRKKYKERGLSFVAFTADYHGPQQHTPKHN
jgi:hypothetical protein